MLQKQLINNVTIFNQNLKNRLAYFNFSIILEFIGKYTMRCINYFIYLYINLTLHRVLKIERLSVRRTMC